MWSAMDNNTIRQYISITGASIEEATRLLEACNGDVNMAVSMHLDNKSVSSNVNDMSTMTSTTGQAVTNDTYEERHGIRAPIPQTQGVLIEQEPIRRMFRRRAIPKSVFDPFQDYSSSSADVGDPTGVPVDDKKKTLAELFRPPVDLMFQGDFAEARLAGQSSNKWLMVNLQDSSEFSCQVLNRDLWSNAMIKKIIHDHFIFWQIQRITDDGIRFKQLYHVDDFPAIIIIDPRTGEKMEHWSHMAVQEFTAKVGEFNSLNKLDDDHSTNKVLTTVYDKSEESQLEEAIKASLAQQAIIISNSDSDSDCLLSPEEELSNTNNSSNSDMEISNNSTVESTNTTTSPVNTYTSNTVRNRKRQLQNDSQCFKRSKNPRLQSMDCGSPTDETVVAGKSELSDDLELVEINDEDDDRNRSKNKRVTIPFNQVDKNINSQDMCRVLIRFPDGSRIIKPFSAEGAIKELFDCLNQEGYPLPEYEVTTTFPHNVISCLPSNATFKDAGLYPRQTVYVQKTD